MQPPTGPPGKRADLSRVLWAAPLTLLVSVIAVICIRLIAVRILNPDPDFQPLTMAPPILDTVIFGGAAVYVFFRMCYFPNPIARYRSLAWKALLVTFVPDIALAVQHWFGGGWPEALALMAMHVAVWALCVTMLPGLASDRRFLPESENPQRSQG